MASEWTGQPQLEVAVEKLPAQRDPGGEHGHAHQTDLNTSVQGRAGQGCTDRLAVHKEPVAVRTGKVVGRERAHHPAAHLQCVLTVIKLSFILLLLSPPPWTRCGDQAGGVAPEPRPVPAPLARARPTRPQLPSDQSEDGMPPDRPMRARLAAVCRLCHCLGGTACVAARPHRRPRPPRAPQPITTHLRLREGEHSSITEPLSFSYLQRSRIFTLSR